MLGAAEGSADQALGPSLEAVAGVAPEAAVGTCLVDHPTVARSEDEMADLQRAQSYDGAAMCRGRRQSL